MMECSAFERQVDRCLEGALSPEELRAFNLHRAVCSRCADLMAIIEGGSSGRAPEIPAGLTRSILDSTSGGGCAGIRLHLCDYVDRTLAEGRLAEIEAHLRDCPSCHGLTRMLRELQPLFQTLASVPEDTRVTERILARTSQSRPGRPDWRTRLQGLFHRPRIELEAAFVGALLFFTLLAVPTGSWNQGPEFVVTAFRDGFQQVRATAPLVLRQQVLPPYERTWTRVSSQVRASQSSLDRTLNRFDSTRAEIRAYSNELAGSLRQAAHEFPRKVQAYYGRWFDGSAD